MGEERLLDELDRQEESLGEGILAYGEAVLWLPEEFPHEASKKLLEERSALFARLMRYHAMKGEAGWVQLYGVLHDVAQGELARRSLRWSLRIAAAALAVAAVVLVASYFALRTANHTDSKIRQLREQANLSAEQARRSSVVEHALLRLIAKQEAADSARQAALLARINHLLAEQRARAQR